MLVRKRFGGCGTVSREFFGNIQTFEWSGSGDGSLRSKTFQMTSLDEVIDPIIGFTIH